MCGIEIGSICFFSGIFGIFLESEAEFESELKTEFGFELKTEFESELKTGFESELEARVAVEF